MRTSSKRLVAVLVLEIAGILLIVAVVLAFINNQTLRTEVPLVSTMDREEPSPAVSTNITPVESVPISTDAIGRPVPGTPATAPTAITSGTTVDLTVVSPTSSQTPAVVITPLLQYIVQAGDTLSGIATRLGVSSADLLAVNPAIVDPNAIQIGQALNIPSVGGTELSASLPLTYTLSISMTAEPYTRLISVLGASQARVDAAYPLSEMAVEGRLVVHYQTGSFVDEHLSQLLSLFSQGYLEVEEQMGGPFSRPLHVYAAGSLFYANEDLRGFTQSGLYRSFILVDGSGNDGERTYYLAHELTHIFAYHRLGQPAGAMLQEGLATYLPHHFLSETGGYLPLSEICAEALAAGRLTPLRELAAAELGPPYFAGHTNNFIQYHQSACFVEYLVDAYGWEKLGQIYTSGAYQAVYGKTLGELESEWLEQLRRVDFQVDPNRFVQMLDQVAGAYQDYYARCSGGWHANWQAYQVLDQARLAAYGGHLEEATVALDSYRGMIAP